MVKWNLKKETMPLLLSFQEMDKLWSLELTKEPSSCWQVQIGTLVKTSSTKS